MAGDLTGPRLKLERANYHLDNLKSHAARFFEAHPYEVVAKDNPETNTREWSVHVRAEVPQGMSLVIGDVVHNLRAALDHLMTQLVIANRREPNTKTEFPIGRSETHYEAIRSGKTKGASKAALGILDGLKPYKGGNDALWRIHQLDIVDKHRLLLTVGAAATGLVIDTASLFRGIPAISSVDLMPPEMAQKITLVTEPNIPIEDGVLILSGPIEGAEVNENLQVPIEIALAEPGVAELEPVFPALHQLMSYVNEVITLFAPLIPDAD